MMGELYMSRAQMEKLEDVTATTELPSEPAMPSYPIHDTGSTIVAQNGEVRPWNWDEVFKGARTEQLAEALLQRFGVDTSLGHMKDTPRRFVAMMKELTESEPFNFTTFEATSDEMIVEVGIPFYTLCAHHVVPFHGRAHVGYVPNAKLAGLSKFGRLVKAIAKGLWVQEELTAAIADALESELEPRGVAVILRGEHMCMSMRGVQMPGVITQTAAMRGVFGDHSRTAKAEFLEAIRDYK
jgi:GTP cyclohydrolase IA